MIRTGFSGRCSAGCEWFAAALPLGTAVGTLCVSSGALDSGRQEIILEAARQFDLAKAGAGVMTFASGAFLSMSVQLIFLFVLGFCAWALPVAVCVPFLRGMGFGCTCACLYGRYGADAFGYILCCFFPDLLFSGLLLAFAAAQMSGMSGKYFSAVLGCADNIPQREDLQCYCGKFLIMLTAAAVASIVEALIAGVYPVKAYM